MHQSIESLPDTESPRKPDLIQRIWITLLKQYAYMIETNTFLEKWATEELLQEIIPWLPVTRELKDPDASEEAKIAHRKRKQTLEVGSSVQLELLFDDAEKKTLKANAISGYPQFKLKHFFATVAPELETFLNHKMSELSADEKYQVSNIRMHKDKISFILQRER